MLIHNQIMQPKACLIPKVLICDEKISAMSTMFASAGVVHPVTGKQLQS